MKNRLTSICSFSIGNPFRSANTYSLCFHIFSFLSNRQNIRMTRFVRRFFFPRCSSPAFYIFQRLRLDSTSLNFFETCKNVSKSKIKIPKLTKSFQQEISTSILHIYIYIWDFDVHWFGWPITTEKYNIFLSLNL